MLTWVQFFGQDKVSLAPNFADQQTFQFQDRPAPNAVFQLVYTGSLGLANEPVKILRLAQQLEQRGIQAHISIYGTGTQKDWLIEESKRLKISNLSFEAWQDKAGIAAILSAADAAIVSFADNTSLAATSPNKWFDALAAGLPCIMACQGWHTNLTVKEQAGVYYDPFAPQAALDQIGQWIAQPDTWRQTRHHAQSLSNQFDKTKIVRHLQGVIDDLLA
jgi:glycosyltransferase involved in cell wall biosynthesis